MMKIAVWDTYVQRGDGKQMHFDILVDSNLKDEKAIFAYGREFLHTKTFKTGNLSSHECQFCHIEEAPAEIAELIKSNGYAIIEMEHCD